MRKYTANYTYTNPNFVIQNLESVENKSDLFPLLCVMKNLLQRGFPTVMSKFLQEKIGCIHERDDYEKRLLLVSASPVHWNSVIKGSADGTYNPARDFIERIIPNELGDLSFIKSMFIPEILINDIIGYDDPEFRNLQVDFYLPQACLVIEIDGSQHEEPKQRALDSKRDEHLKRYGIETIRFKTSDLRSQNYQIGINKLKNRIERYMACIRPYSVAYSNAIGSVFTDDEVKFKLIPTAIIRFQILLVELLINQVLEFGEQWKFNIKCDENLGDFAQLAIEDVYIWLNQLSLLRDKEELPELKYKVNLCSSDEFEFDVHSINVDFSLLKNYTDENTSSPDIIFIRSDYFLFKQGRNMIGLDRNYFRVSTAQSIDYKVTDLDKPVLQFFLQNLFNKQDFRDGQFSIISNALNMRDTIGLLPTGGGKSLCYQLPCLLQPSINFIVCPIKSLMYDQMDNLKRLDVSISNVNMICGDQDGMEKDRVMYDYSMGRYLFMWISPERFQIKKFRESISAIISNLNISYAVVDEVHCLSEWGHDFRTSYLNLAKTIDSLSPKDEYGEGRIKFIGLTATASVNVLKDIKIEFSRRKQQLEDDNIKTLIDYTRPELEFIILHEDDKFNSLLESFDNENIPNDESKATLIFTPHVNGDFGCHDLANQLNIYYPGQVAWYSGTCPKIRTPEGLKRSVMSPKEFDDYKARVQSHFKDNSYQILCATKAFGMGIDKQNIFYTYHYCLPASVESLYQEAGRAGRWDKSLPENASKKAKCFVLHSLEYIHNTSLVEELFSPNTSILRMNEILDSVRDGNDIFTQMFLFLGQLQDIEKEFKNIIKVIELFFKENRTRDVHYKEFRDYENIYITESEFEKIIYRLCLLGIVDDWTRDFIDSFTIKFNSLDDEHIANSLESYIKKYDPSERVRDNINAIDNVLCDSYLKKSVWYLLDWIFRHITENRKQSLKTLYDWSLDFTDSISLKSRLDAYFTFNESTYILQHIAEHPDDIEKWFEVFYINDQFITIEEVRKLKDRLSRFLESYHNAPGLNFVSGVVRFLINDFDDTDGRERLLLALEYIKGDNLSRGLSQPLYEFKFHDGMKKLIHNVKDCVSMEQLCDIVELILLCFPDMTTNYSKEFEMPWLNNARIKNGVERLRKLNIKLYESFGRL